MSITADGAQPQLPAAPADTMRGADNKMGMPAAYEPLGYRSRRLFRETPDGKREYLTDKELSDARARAKQAVDDYCS